MPASEAVYVGALQYALIILLVIEAIILVRLVSGFIVLSYQTNLLKILGNVVCGLTTTYFSPYSSFFVNLPTGRFELDEIDVTTGGPNLIGLFSYDQKSGYSQYVPITLEGEIVKEGSKAIGKVIIKGEKFKPVLISRNRGEIGSLEVKWE